MDQCQCDLTGSRYDLGKPPTPQNVWVTQGLTVLQEAPKQKFWFITVEIICQQRMLTSNSQAANLILRSLTAEWNHARENNKEEEMPEKS